MHTISKDKYALLSYTHSTVSEFREVLMEIHHSLENTDLSTNTLEIAPNIAQHMQVIDFIIEGEKYAIDILEIEEIIRVETITPVPRSAKSILGVVNLHGRVIPVLSFRILLQLEEAPITEDTRIIMIAENNYGLLVDSVREVSSIALDSITSLTARTSHNFIDTASVTHEDTLLPIINTQKLFQYIATQVQQENTLN